MSRVAILNIGHGDFQQGFEVSLEIKDDGGKSMVAIEGKLPANTDIENLYRSWQESFYGVTRIYRNREDWDIDESIPTNIANSNLVLECSEKVRRLEANMQSWLQPLVDNINWHKIRERLAEELARHSSEIGLIIKARKEIIWKLPWHVWDLLSKYPDVGIGYSTVEYARPLCFKQTTHNKVGILAVFGDSQNIDLTEDRQALIDLNDTEAVFLDEPNSRELIKKLRDDRGWDIFFFAGHSQSETNTGRIYLNDRESLTSEQFKNSLTEAISKGLKIAIFNSCDGLALAQKLADLHIPVVIVMQEIVPDRIAQSFLTEFLTEYHSGQPLYTAVRRAQTRLEEFTDFPGATWLPLIFQNPTTVPPQWNDLVNDNPEYPSLCQLLPLLPISLIISAMVLGVRWLGILQPLELYAFDRLMQLQSVDEKPEPRILVVTVDEKDIKYQDSQAMVRNGSSLSDLALDRALDKLEILKPTTITLDIYRPAGFHPAISHRLQQDDRFFAICKIQEFNSLYSGGVAPPPEIDKQRLVFSDVPVDKYDIVRRQFLDMTSGNLSDPCHTRYSLSFLVAQHYLFVEHNIEAVHTPKKEWQLGNVVFKKLSNHSSGYHQLDDAGYQILLNYRRNNSSQPIAYSISLKELLEQGISESIKERIKKPIILIGTIDRSYEDYHLTPYGKEIPGVFLQAQMISLILSAVLDNRPLLWYWHSGIEAIWIWFWSITGGLLSITIWQRWRLLLNVFCSIFIIVAICFFLFAYGGWIPLIPPVLALLITTFLVAKKNRFC